MSLRRVCTTCDGEGAIGTCHPNGPDADRVAQCPDCVGVGTIEAMCDTCFRFRRPAEVYDADEKLYLCASCAAEA